jgi:hypothetical protein
MKPAEEIKPGDPKEFAQKWNIPTDSLELLEKKQ